MRTRRGRREELVYWYHVAPSRIRLVIENAHAHVCSTSSRESSRGESRKKKKKKTRRARAVISRVIVTSSVCPRGASRPAPVGASFAAHRGVMAVRDAAAAMRSPDAGSATVGGTFPDDPPRPAPLMVPETAPEWSPAELERYLHVVAMERHAAHAIRRHDLMDRLHQHCDGVGNPNPLLLLGPPGSGKSTALATLMSEIEGGPAARRRRDSASLGGAPDGAGADTPPPLPPRPPRTPRSRSRAPSRSCSRTRSGCSGSPTICDARCFGCAPSSSRDSTSTWTCRPAWRTSARRSRASSRTPRSSARSSWCWTGWTKPSATT